MSAPHDITGTRGEASSTTIPLASTMWTARLRFYVAPPGISVSFDGLSVLIRNSGAPAYNASVELHLVADNEMTANAVGATVAEAWGLTMLQCQTAQVLFHRVDVREGGRGPGNRIGTGTVTGGNGTASGDPVMPGLCAPLVMVAGVGTPRRRGRIWWPGMPCSWVSADSAGLTSDAINAIWPQWSALHGRLHDGGTELVVAHPDRWGPRVCWVPCSLGVSAQLRTFGRRWRPQNVRAQDLVVITAALPEVEL